MMVGTSDCSQHPCLLINNHKGSSRPVKLSCDWDWQGDIEILASAFHLQHALRAQCSASRGGIRQSEEWDHFHFCSPPLLLRWEPGWHQRILWQGENDADRMQ
jgi:hypothetical protein